MKTGIRRFAETAAFLIFSAMTFFACAGKPAPLEPEVARYNILLSPEAEELVRKGVACHDQREYEKAIEYYNQAFGFAPDHPVIYYEMGFSYVAMNENEKALELAEKGITGAKALNYTEIIPTLLDLKGSALNNLNRNQEAAAVYSESINEYGVSDTFMYYNLGVSYYRIDRRAEAFDALRKGLSVNANHANSNYLLGRICAEDGKMTQSFYALCYFLLLEPNSDRAVQAYNTVLHMLEQRETDFRDNGSFTAADMIISAAFTLDKENARLSPSQKTEAKFYYVFTNMEEQKNSGKINRGAGDELWWDFYSPFFYRIAKSGYFGTFCRYIGLTVDPGADDWIENGRDEIEGFFEWLNDYLEN